jgi:hypothetical protein
MTDYTNRLQSMSDYNNIQLYHYQIIVIDYGTNVRLY